MLTTMTARAFRPLVWLRCPGCNQSATSMYNDVIACLRCKWFVQEAK